MIWYDIQMTRWKPYKLYLYGLNNIKRYFYLILSSFVHITNRNMPTTCCLSCWWLVCLYLRWCLKLQAAKMPTSHIASGCPVTKHVACSSCCSHQRWSVTHGWLALMPLGSASQISKYSQCGRTEGPDWYAHRVCLPMTQCSSLTAIIHDVMNRDNWNTVFGDYAPKWLHVLNN